MEVLHSVSVASNSCDIFSAKTLSVCNSLLMVLRVLNLEIRFSNRRSLQLNFLLLSKAAFLRDSNVNWRPFSVIFRIINNNKSIYIALILCSVKHFEDIYPA